jgi:AcrR family transcriptional regulator
MSPTNRAATTGATGARRSGRPSAAEAERIDRDVRDAALALFLERGYDGTTMDAIAQAAGTTKASLYARFDSKEAVFSAVLDVATRRRDWPLPEPAPPDLDDLEGALTEIAQAGVQRAVHPEMVKLSRIAITESARFPELARRAQANATWARRDLVVELLQRHAAAGAIVVADEPEILAEHFLAMAVGMPARLASFGIVRDAETQAHYTQVAVALFVRGLRA